MDRFVILPRDDEAGRWPWTEEYPDKSGRQRKGTKRACAEGSTRHPGYDATAPFGA